MPEKLQLRLHGVNICDRTPLFCDARLIEKLHARFRASGERNLTRHVAL